MVGYYNYTVFLTYVGTIFGFVGITFIWNGNLKAALICLMLAGFCDMFDGKVASTKDRTKQEKRFGIQIDSLSDLICFGALPAIITFQVGRGSVLHTAVAAVYLLCALIRLAWFNVDEEERQTQEVGGRKAYLGLPVTSAALIIPFLLGIGYFFKLPMKHIIPCITFLIAIAFISPFNLKKAGLVGKLLFLVLGVVGLTMVLIGVPS